MRKPIETVENLKSYYGERHHAYLKNWQKSRAGISDNVPLPWEPVRVENTTAIVWGRKYVFDNMFLPARITSQGEEILAGPIELILRINGKSVNVRAGVKLISQNPGKAIFRYKTENETLSLSADIEVEYDGMVKASLGFAPNSAIGINVEKFIIRIPVKKSLAKLYHIYPGIGWGNAYNSGKLPNSGLKLDFKPYLWLGNTEMGVSFFTETNENWRNRNEKEAIIVSETDDTVDLTIKVIDRDYKLNKETKYVFGMQATPVKPFPEDWHKHHFAHVCYYGIDKQSWKGSGRISLKYPGAGNVNPDEGTITFQVSLMFDPKKEIELPSHPPEQELTLRRIFRGIYARKLMTLRLNKEKEAFLALYWYVPKKCFRVYLAKGKGDMTVFPLILDAPVKWKKNEWHHLMLSYGKKIRVYADNKLLAEAVAPAEIKQLADSGDMQLQFGGHEGCDFALADVRVSKIEINEFDIKQSPQADDNTLLLDHLDDIAKSAGKCFSKPEKIASGTGGEITGEIKLVGDHGRKGLLLCEDRPARTTLEHLKDYGVNVLVFHEHWSNIQDYPDYYHKKEIREIARLCHKNKMKLMVYFGFSMSDINPEWGKYYQKCLRKLPEVSLDATVAWYRHPEQKAYGVCWNSVWENFMAHSIEKVMKDFNVDGVYLDGTVHPFGCKNYLHGCGYKTVNNEYKPTYPIFAVRDLMKRIYNICVGEHQGLVSAHNSTCAVMPSLGFATSYWDGEQFNVPLNEDPLSVLPLETFQAEFMGRNHGLPAEFLTYAPFVWTVEEALAFTLIHDVLIRPINVGPMLITMSKIWRIQDEFDCDGSEWFPYYRKQELAEVTGDKIKVSYFINKKSGRILLIAANLDKKENCGKIKINARVFGKNISFVRELPEETEIKTRNSAIEVSLAELGVKIMLIE
jgi:hypothetical protein